MARSGPSPSPSAFSAPLATPPQLSALPSPNLSRTIYLLTHQTLTASHLLHLPHSVGVHASILLQRYFLSHSSEDSSNSTSFSAAALYLASKLSHTPAASPRDLSNVYAYLSLDPPFGPPPGSTTPNPNKYFVTEGDHQQRRQTLFATEAKILRTLGFQLAAPQPFALAVQYIQALGLFDPGSTSKGKRVARRAHAHLNTALVSPQLLYLTQPPHVLAVAAVYLGAREAGVKLPEGGWWEVFDVEREELGFVVVGILSVEQWVRNEVGHDQGEEEREEL